MCFGDGTIAQQEPGKIYELLRGRGEVQRYSVNGQVYNSLVEAEAAREAAARLEKRRAENDTSKGVTGQSTGTPTEIKRSTGSSSGGTSGGGGGGGGGGGASADNKSVEDLVNDPEAAASEQERLAAEELRRQRISRAREKQTLLQSRLDRRGQFGSGRKELTGQEKSLPYATSRALIGAATGIRGGMGRRSLLTGSSGGIGFYSRYL